MSHYVAGSDENGCLSAAPFPTPGSMDSWRKRQPPETEIAGSSLPRSDGTLISTESTQCLEVQQICQNQSKPELRNQRLPVQNISGSLAQS